MHQSNKQKQKKMENSICKITFKTSCKLRFVKGAKYIISPMVGLPGVKLFRIYSENGNSFATDQAHVNKFFNLN